MKESEKTMLYPCGGTPELGIPQDHIYRLNSKKGPFVTKETARKICPERWNLLTSGEYITCSICQSYKDGKLEINLL